MSPYTIIEEDRNILCFLKILMELYYKISSSIGG